jgi:hypothetical protein
VLDRRSRDGRGGSYREEADGGERRSGESDGHTKDANAPRSSEGNSSATVQNARDGAYRDRNR